MTVSSADFWIERKIFIAAPAGLALIAILVALVALAVTSGRADVADRNEALSAFVADVEKERAQFRAELEAIEGAGEARSPYEAQPFNIRIPATAPPAPLAVFSGGDSLYPSSTKIGASRSAAELFSGYEFANPTLLAAERFDLVFVVVVILPLLMIAASFDALAGEKTSGRARLAVAQGASIGSSVARRLAIRNGALFAALAAAAIGGAIWAGSGSSEPILARLAAWLGGAAIYALFWHGLILCAVAMARSAETTATLLAAIWLTLTFVMPAGVSAAAEAIYPPPSRLAYLTEMRAAKAEAARDAERLRKDYFEDHPELFVSDELAPDYYTNAYLANRQVEERTAPIAAAFEKARQQRTAFVETFQLISPPMLADRALTAIAGSGAARAGAFQRQAQAMLAALTAAVAPAILERKRLSLAAYDALPAFAFEEPPISDVLQRFAAPFAILALMAILLLTTAHLRLRAPLEKLL